MRASAAVLTLLLVHPVLGLAQEPPYIPPDEHIVAVTPADLDWREGPAGSRMAVLYGNPAQEGFYVVRVKFPPGSEIPLHWHPTTEFFTVLSGTVHVAFGRDATRAEAVEHGPGSFTALPAHMPVRAWIGSEEVIFEGYGHGPFHTVLLEPRAASGSR